MGWRVMAAETVAANWVAAIEAKHASVRVVVVARLIATHADEGGLVRISRNYIQKASHAATCLDAARRLQALQGCGWLATYAQADPATRAPRTFLLATPERASAYDYTLIR